MERGWLCLVLVLTKQNSGRVSLDRVVSVLLVNTNSVPAEALIVGSEEHFWLSAGLSFYILIVTSQLVSEYYQTTEDTTKVSED